MGTVFDFILLKNIIMEMQPITIIATALTLVPVILIIKTAIAMARDRKIR
jgi:hypothetical protein